MCDQYVLKTRDRLFFHCDFAKLCWRYICHNWSPLTGNIHDHLGSLKDMMQLPFSMDIIILTSKAIWKSRNDFIFRGITPSPHESKHSLGLHGQHGVIECKIM